jgi:hypothetical protein
MASQLGSLTAVRTERGSGDASGGALVVAATLAYRGFGLKMPACARVTICRIGGECAWTGEGAAEEQVEPSAGDRAVEVELEERANDEPGDGVASGVPVAGVEGSPEEDGGAGDGVAGADPLAGVEGGPPSSELGAGSCRGRAICGTTGR